MRQRFPVSSSRYGKVLQKEMRNPLAQSQREKMGTKVLEKKNNGDVNKRQDKVRFTDMKKVYEWEDKTWPKFQSKSIPGSDAHKYLKKFARHFKVPMVYVSLSKINGGSYTYSSRLVKLAPITSLDIIVHEFAHHLADVSTGQRNYHNKQFKRSLKKVYTFAKRYL